MVASIPAIVTQEQFERVQDKLAQNRQFARRNNTAHAYLLRALVSCGVCGLACQGRCLPSGYRYYFCRGKLSALHSPRPTKCPSRYIPTKQVDALGWEDLCRLLNEPEAIRLRSSGRMADIGCPRICKLAGRRCGADKPASSNRWSGSPRPAWPAL